MIFNNLALSHFKKKQQHAILLSDSPWILPQSARGQQDRANKI